MLHPHRDYRKSFKFELLYVVKLKKLKKLLVWGGATFEV